MAIVQGTLLYAAELTCNGQNWVEGEYQAATNRMIRGFQVNPSGHRGFGKQAKALLNHRQAKFAQRLWPRGCHEETRDLASLKGSEQWPWFDAGRRRQKGRHGGDSSTSQDRS